MATADNFLNSGIQNFATSSNWSTGSVPNSSNDADIALNSGTIVGSSTSETVNSIGTASLDTLDVTGGTFDALNGTGPNQNLGTVFVGAASFEIANGTFENGTLNINIHNTAPETIKLNAQSSTLLIGGSVSLTGHGNVEMVIVSGDSPLANLIEGTTSSATLTNVNNDISGTGAIGQMNFINESLIETNNATSSSAGSLAILGSQAGGSFDNTSTGTVQVDNGGTVELGVNNGQASTIINQGLISILGSTATTTLAIGASLHLTGGGHVELDGSNSDDDYIESYNHSSATLDNENNTISGGGQIGDGSTNPLTVDNEGVFDADDSTPYPMYFFPTTVVNDGGTLEATTGGGISIAYGTINNTGGTIQAVGGGSVGIAFETINGSGSILIGQGSGFLLDDVTITGNVQFTGPNARLTIESPSSGILSNIEGGISGVQATDTIDLNYANFVSGIHAVWQQTSGSAGTLSLYSHGTDVATLGLNGTFTSLDFSTTQDYGTGTLITVQNPTYTENPGNIDEWILSDGNWAASAGPVLLPLTFPAIPIRSPVPAIGLATAPTASCGSTPARGTRRVAVVEHAMGGQRRSRHASRQFYGWRQLSDRRDRRLHRLHRQRPRRRTVDQRQCQRHDCDRHLGAGFQRQMGRQRQPRQSPGRLFSRRHWRLDRRRHRRNSVAKCINRRHRRVAIVRRRVVSQR